MTCPSCGAHNTAEASWCTQCFAPLTHEGGAASRPAPPAPPSGPPPGPPSEPSDRPFRTRGDQVEWRCRRCHAWNPLDDPVCATCGTPLADDPYRPSPERTARTRRVLWIVAGAVCAVVLVVLVLLLAALQGT